MNSYRWLLSQIIDSLPTKRDWLDPAIEREARAQLAQPEADGLAAIREAAQMFRIRMAQPEPEQALDSDLFTNGGFVSMGMARRLLAAIDATPAPAPPCNCWQHTAEPCPAHGEPKNAEIARLLANFNEATTRANDNWAEVERLILEIARLREALELALRFMKDPGFYSANVSAFINLARAALAGMEETTDAR